MPENPKENAVKKTRRKNKSDLGQNYVAPDGGWGWIVCIAAGVSNMVALPGLQQFGLIFRKNLADLHVSSTQISTLINTQFAFGAFTGLFNGPLFYKFTFREVGLAGSALVSIGLLLSAWSQNFIQYILTFSILYGTGVGLTQTSGSLAINTYFKENRRKATGFAFTIAGVGPILFPYLTVWVLENFGYIATVLTFAGISMISLIAIACYRPALQFSKGAGKIDIQKEEVEIILESKPKGNEKMSHLKKFLMELDLGLLKDKSFLNLLIGLTINIFVEINFSVLAPFILGEAGFLDQQISLIMSVSAIVDIAARFLGPFATEKLPFGNKSLFAFGVLTGSVGRWFVAMTKDFYVIIFAFTLLGFGKAFRKITRPLVIADYVPLKRLPAASGLQLASTALFSLSAGPVIGLIKERWGYEVTIHIFNIMSILSLLSWGIEELLIRLVSNGR